MCIVVYQFPIWAISLIEELHIEGNMEKTYIIEYTQNTKSCRIKMPIDPELYLDEIINS